MYEYMDLKKTTKRVIVLFHLCLLNY